MLAWQPGMLRIYFIHICCDDIYVGPGEAALSRSFALRMWNASNVYGTCLLGCSGLAACSGDICHRSPGFRKSQFEGEKMQKGVPGDCKSINGELAMLCPADDVLATQHWWVRVSMATGQSAAQLDPCFRFMFQHLWRQHHRCLR